MGRYFSEYLSGGFMKGMKILMFVATVLLVASTCLAETPKTGWQIAGNNGMTSAVVEFRSEPFDATLKVRTNEYGFLPAWSSDLGSVLITNIKFFNKTGDGILLVGDDAEGSVAFCVDTHAASVGKQRFPGKLIFESKAPDMGGPILLLLLNKSQKEVVLLESHCKSKKTAAVFPKDTAIFIDEHCGLEYGACEYLVFAADEDIGFLYKIAGNDALEYESYIKIPRGMKPAGIESDDVKKELKVTYETTRNLALP